MKPTKKYFYLSLLVVLFINIQACNHSQKKEAIATSTTSKTSLFNGTKSFNAAKSTIQWKGHKLLGSHEGLINLRSGEITIENNKIVKGNFIVDMNSISATQLMDEGEEEEEEENNNETNDEDSSEGGHDDKSELAQHLKDKDFFDTATYPEALFSITTTEKLSANEYLITGNLTIKNITKPINFKATVTSETFTANISVNRTDFGIKYGSGSFFENLGDNIIKDNFDLIAKLSYN